MKKQEFVNLRCIHFYILKTQIIYYRGESLFDRHRLNFICTWFMERWNFIFFVNNKATDIKVGFKSNINIVFSKKFLKNKWSWIIDSVTLWKNNCKGEFKFIKKFKINKGWYFRKEYYYLLIMSISRLKESKDKGSKKAFYKKKAFMGS